MAWIVDSLNLRAEIMRTKPMSKLLLSLGSAAFVFVACCGVVAALALASSPNAPANDSDAQLSRKFAELSDQFMKESLALSPSNASAAGYHKHVDAKTGKTIELDAVLDDLSERAIAGQRAFYAQWRERFRSETPAEKLNPEDAADWHSV